MGGLPQCPAQGRAPAHRGVQCRRGRPAPSRIACCCRPSPIWCSKA
jgi:hypothetical protein